MEESKFISVRNKAGRLQDFRNFMEATTLELSKSAKTGKVDFSEHQGEKFEWIVLNHMKSIACDFNFNPEDIIHTEKQHFPDIISENYFGVEVKATKEDSWTSIGSSITESLREACVKKIFLMFGKLSIPNVEFRCKPYEDCMYDISVTHNPRYLINMDLSPKDKTIFDKIGMEYDLFRVDNNRIQTIRKYYREKYKNNGKEMPWWIGEDEDDISMQRINHEGDIKLYSSLSKCEKDYLKFCGFILFPEVLKSQYDKLALWMCSRHSIVNHHIRDMYTAGGQMNLYIDNKLVCKNLCKSICNFVINIESIRNVFINKTDVYKDISFYSDYYTTPENIFKDWKSCVNSYIYKILRLPIEDILHLDLKEIRDSNIFLISNNK